MKKTAYGAYAQPKSYGNLQHVENLLGLASNHMNNAAQALKEKDYLKLYHECHSTRDILLGLARDIQFDSNTESPALQMMYNFLTTMAVLIVKMQTKRDLATCEQIVKSLEKVTYDWGKASQQ